MPQRLLRPGSIAILALIALAPPAFASGVTVSFFLGPDWTKVTGETAYFAPRNKLGMSAGIAFGIPLGARFSIVPEAGYAVRGFSWGLSSDTDINGNVIGTFETFTVTDVLTLSFSARAGFPLGGRWSANLSLGPTVGIEHDEHFVSDYGGGSARLPDDYLRPSDVGLLGGGGIDVALGPGRCGVGARYVLGFSDLSRDPLIERRTRALEIVAIYTAPLGK